jgi:hypothetical protein
MPPTIMVTVGRLLVELEPPLVDVLLPPDEQAATVSAVVHAAASAASEPLLKPALRMVPLLVSLRGKVGESGEEKTGKRRKGGLPRLNGGGLA